MSSSGSQEDTKKVGAVMVVGGGICGMQSALDLANSGFKVYLVEEKSSIGGRMAQLDKTFPTNDCSMCMISPKLIEVDKHLNIEMVTNADVLNVKGEPGNFEVSIRKRARYIDESLCIGCSTCMDKCPWKADSEFEMGLAQRKAIFVPFPQAIPNTPIIDKTACAYFQTGKCRACEKFCPTHAIDFEQTDRTIVMNVGSVILAPGYEPFDAALKGEYGYGRMRNVVTSLEFERILSASGPYQGQVLRPSDSKHPVKIAWLQCVGSRDETCGREYCSSVCCMYATKQAIIAREHASKIQPAIFHNDVRAFGKGFERYYESAKDKFGVRYIRGYISAVKELQQSNNLLLEYRGEDGSKVREEFDMVVLSIGEQCGACPEPVYRR
jgi:heterodisulfide reductase subunit A